MEVPVRRSERPITIATAAAAAATTTTSTTPTSDAVIASAVVSAAAAVPTIVEFLAFAADIYARASGGGTATAVEEGKEEADQHRNKHLLSPKKILTGLEDIIARLIAAAVAHHHHHLLHQGDGDGQSAKLVVQADDDKDKDVSKDDDAIGLLVKACVKVARDLVVHFSRIGGGDGKKDEHEGGDVPASRFTEVWGAEDVRILGKRIWELMGRLEKVVGSSDVLQWKTLFGPDVIRFISSQDREQEASSQDHDHDPREEHRKAVPEKPKTIEIHDKISGITTTMTIPTRKPRQVSAALLNDFILESLSFKSMTDREEEVAEAHANTFDWIFADIATGGTGGAGSSKRDSEKVSQRFGHEFTKWLETDALGGIYWINGKAGSGKSTLFRYLYESSRTTQFLKSWAGRYPLSKAGFFFWTSGSREQRSQTGLLRYLLHQLLSANEELIPKAFPSLWQKLLFMDTKERIKLALDWSIPELLAAFQSFLDSALPIMRVCLFIDGLDEFDGDHVQIIQFFKNIAEGKHGGQIKMCLSSRPWEVFETAFDGSVPNLRLQDLTYQDMFRYVSDKLNAHAVVRRVLRRTPADTAQLLQETVQRADGVFLWVRLAVTKMLERFETGDSIAKLRSVLVTLPTDLDNLFDKLLFTDQNIPELTQTSQLFQLVRSREVVVDFIRDESANSLSVWEIAFAVRDEDDRPALELDVQEATDEVIHSRCQETRELVHSRSVGLLEVFAKNTSGNNRRGARFAGDEDSVQASRILADHKVTYIHRTVRDYLMQSEGIWQRLVKASASRAFDPHLRLLRSYVLRLKFSLEEIEHHRRLNEWYPDIALAMTHARYIEHDPHGHEGRFINELKDTISWYWLPKSTDPDDHWARHTFGSYETRMKAPPIREPFLALAIKFGLKRYIKEELDKQQAQVGSAHDVRSDDENADDDKSAPLVFYATEFLCSRQKTLFPLSSPELIQLLLAHPTQPSANHPYIDFTTRAPRTPWIALLRHLRNARRRRWIGYYDVDSTGTERWTAAVRIFLKSGHADVDAVVVKDVWDPEITALGVIELLLETYGAFEVAKLRDLLVEKGARK